LTFVDHKKRRKGCFLVVNKQKYIVKKAGIFQQTHVITFNSSMFCGRTVMKNCKKDTAF